MKRFLLCLSLVAAAPALAAEKYVATLIFSSASVRTIIKKNTNYTMRCTVPVRYAVAADTSAVALRGVTDGGATSFYIDTTTLPYFDFNSGVTGGYLNVIPDPAAAGQCELFERVP